MNVLKKLALYAFLIGVAPLALLEGVFRLLPVSSPPYLLPVSASDPVPRYQPSVEYRYSWGPDFGVRSHKRTNNYGYTHFADYAPEARTPLLMVIGDSFVEANTVDVGKSAPELLHAGLSGKGRVYSMAVSGAPLSQYLVFAHYARKLFRPDAMAFVVISNDFDESLLKYKAEPRFHYFDERGGRAELRRIDYQLSPTKRTLRNSALLRYLMYNVALEQRLQAILNPGTPAAWVTRDGEPAEVLERRLADSQRAVDYFFEHLPAMSGLPAEAIVFVLDAVRPAIYAEAALERAAAGFHAQMRSYFTVQAKARRYAVVDMQPVFIARHRRDGSRFEFPTDSHWNELGHRLVAEELAKSPVFARVFRGGGLIAASAGAPVAPKELGAPAEVPSGKF